MRIIFISDPVQNGVEGGTLIDGYDYYQNKDKKHYHYESVIFFCAVYHSTTHVISHPAIAAIFDVILSI